MEEVNMDVIVIAIISMIIGRVVKYIYRSLTK